MQKSFAPVMLDLIGTEITAEERELIQHSLVGGIILFTRNFVSPDQIKTLCLSIRETNPNLWIGVDHEGGRVQRFRSGFTTLPSQGLVGQLYDCSNEDGLELAKICGWIMASELRAVGVDFSFAPVIDLNKKLNTVIGDRAFHRDPKKVISLASSLIHGMHEAGMPAIGKHFPGHGSVALDSHLATPKDERTLNEISLDDLLPFATLIQKKLQGIMPAHIIFSEVDKDPVGFSKIWLKDILRQQLGFQGVIFSDDLNMEGASHYKNYQDRAEKALEAGCDMVLICNNRNGAYQILNHLTQNYYINEDKFKNWQKADVTSINDLQQTEDWQVNHGKLMQFTQRNEYDTTGYS